MDSILSTVNAKTAALPSSEEIPDSSSPVEQFHAVMERLNGGSSHSGYSGDAKPARVNPTGARSHKNAQNQKTGSPGTNGFKTGRDSHHSTADSSSGSTPASHTLGHLVPAENPASPAVELANASLMAAPAAKVDNTAVASPAQTQTQSGVSAGLGAAGKKLAAANRGAIAQQYLSVTGWQGARAQIIGKANLNSLSAEVEMNSAGRTAQTSGEIASDKLSAGAPAKSSASTINLPQILMPAGNRGSLLLQAGLEIKATTALATEEDTVLPGLLQTAEMKSASLAAAGNPVEPNSTATIKQPNAQPSSTDSLERSPTSAQESGTTFTSTGSATALRLTAADFAVNVSVPGTSRLSSEVGELGIDTPLGMKVFPGQTGLQPSPTSEATSGAQTGTAVLNKKDGAGDSDAAAQAGAGKTVNAKTNPVLPEAVITSGAVKNSPPPQTGSSLAAAGAGNTPATAPSHGQTATPNSAPSAAKIAGPDSAVQNPSAGVALNNHGDSSASHTSIPSPFASGTGVAQQETPMKMAAKQNKFAGAIEQKLPGNSTLPGKQVLPPPSEHLTAPAAGQSQNSYPQAVAASVASSDAPAKMISTAISSSSTISPSSAQTVERTQDLVAMQIVQMRDSGADSLRVVIKPDAGLQLSLQLQQHDGGIDVQARVDHGDYNLLNQHWGELQQQFEARGIRVAPLSTAEHFSGGGGEGFHQPSRSHGQLSEEDAAPTPTGAHAPGYPSLATATSASASTTSSRRWETWA